MNINNPIVINTTEYILNDITNDFNNKDLLNKYNLTIKDLPKALYPIHVVLLEKIYDETSYIQNRMFVPICFEVLKRIFNKRKVEDILLFLVENGYLRTNGSYKKGLGCRKYRLGEKYINDQVKTTIIYDKPILKKLNKFKNWKYQQIPNDPVYKQLLASLLCMTIDFPNAEKDLSDKLSKLNCETIKGLDNDNEFSYTKHSYGQYAIECIERYDYRFGVCATNKRVDTNFTNLPRYLRKYILLDGEHIGGWDLANSQPLLFNLLINDYINLKNLNSCELLNKEWEIYKRLTENGYFYQYFGLEFSDRYGYNISKDDIKEGLFQQVFFSESDHFKNAKIKVLFIELFPKLYEIIKYYKEVSYQNLAIKLQAKESKLFINNICGALFEKYPEIKLLTLHDSIYCKISDLEKLKPVILEECKKLGINPTLKQG